MIGEAENRAVLARHTPAMAKRRDAAGEMRSEARIKNLHSLTSMRLIWETICWSQAFA